jgi:DNA invertase Pin-like site-specific DNA recombinase
LRIGYARVSTEDQSTALQIDALRAARCDRIFEDRISGRTRSRPGLDAALACIGAGDQIVVWRLDRLGRNFGHLVAIADELRGRGANLISLSEGIDTSSSVGEVIFRLLSVFSDFERNVIVERTVAGLSAARARGVRLGRASKMSPTQIAEARALVDGGMRAEMVASRYNVGRTTLFRHLKSSRDRTADTRP